MEGPSGADVILHVKMRNSLSFLKSGLELFKAGVRVDARNKTRRCSSL